MAHAFGPLDELGEGFRKARGALGVTAFGANADDEDLVIFIVGGKGGYVERDGQLVDPNDLQRRQQFSSTGGAPE